MPYPAGRSCSETLIFCDPSSSLPDLSFPVGLRPSASDASRCLQVAKESMLAEQLAMKLVDLRGRRDRLAPPSAFGISTRFTDFDLDVPLSSCSRMARQCCFR